MKIIFFCSSIDQTDGWSRYSYDVVKRVSNFAEVSLICNKEIASEEYKQIAILRPAMHYFINPVFILLDVYKVRKAVKKELSGKDDILHFTVEGYALFAPWLWGIKAKKVMTTHGTYSVLPLMKFKTRFLYKLAYKNLNRIIAVSQYTKKHLLSYACDFLREDKIYVITNGVDFVERDITKINRPKNSLTIVSVGQVKKRKGCDHLIRVARILKEKYRINFCIKVIGSFDENSKYCQNLIEYVLENDLVDFVEFKGKISQEELEDVYRHANLFALLSVNEDFHYEGYPLVFHEAAMWGLPTIGSYNCGAEDAIQDGKTGLLVDPYDHEDVANKIYQIWKGDIRINAKDCQEWARVNSWDNKDLMQMYIF